MWYVIKNSMRGLFLVLGLLALSGCVTMRYQAPGPGQPISPTARIGEGQPIVVKHFLRKRHIGWTFAGLVPVRLAQVERVIQEEMARAGGQADGVINLAVREGFEFPGADFFLTLLGGFGILYHSRTIWIEGDLVRYLPAESPASAQ